MFEASTGRRGEEDLVLIRWKGKEKGICSSCILASAVGVQAAAVFRHLCLSRERERETERERERQRERERVTEREREIKREREREREREKEREAP